MDNEKKTDLWILKSKVRVDYDCHFGFVIEARNSKQARLIASQEPSGNKEIWVDPSKSSCERLRPDGKVGIVLDSFRAG